MLQSIRVKNLALVDDITINFDKGLNILTGETGAGKSVLMNSINLCLGGKADKSLISYGKDEALIEVIFVLQNNEKNDEIRTTLVDLGIDIEEDEDDEFMLIISRRIGNKSICRINGELVNTKALQTIGAMLIDAHSQHETSKLLNPNKHIDILDQSFGFQNSALKEQSVKAYKYWKEKREELEKAKNEKMLSNRELSLAKYEIEEIESANLLPNEDVELEEKYALMRNGQKIYTSINLILSLISNDNETCMSDLIGIISKEFNSISDTNKKSENIYEQIIEIEELIRDLDSSLNDLLDDCQFSDEEFYEIENRLNTINTLKSKYGNSIEEILEYLEERQTYIQKMENYEEYLSNLQKEEQKAKEELDNIHSKITAQRKQAALELGKNVENAMRGLNFNDAQFRIDISETTITSNGRDRVEFMAILNKGMQEQPLANVASGGELSRVMLALKSIIASKDSVDTLIFDEIDAGISGNTAWMVGEKLYTTANNKQVLCITHLPQIAAFANHHYMIEKTNINDKATTNIYKLDDNGINEELSRLSGVNNKESIEELKNKAKQFIIK